MEFDNTFEVPVPIEEAWPILMDIERIAPCVPGAELTDVLDDRTYKGKIAVRLGPVALSFNGQAKFEDLDDDAHTARIKAQGTDSKGRGGAQAVVEFSMEPSENGAKVLIHTNLQLSGAVAQYGRGVGMVADLAQHIIGQFADNLAKNVLAQKAGGGDQAQAAPAAPVEVGSLGLKVLWNAIVRGIKRLFGGG